MANAARLPEIAMNRKTRRPLYELRLSAMGTIECQSMPDCSGMRSPTNAVTTGANASMKYPGRVPATRHTAASNAVFDASLRERDPEWGVRDIGALEALARPAGLALAEIAEMPANNLILVFERAKAV